MGLILFSVEVVFSLVLVACMNAKTVIQEPLAIRYVECCDPGLSANDKESCMESEGSPDHVRLLKQNLSEKYLWSAGNVGEEPWRKYETH